MTQPMTPREKVELRPCPFCGGPAERVTIMSRVGVRCADALCAGSHRLPTEGEDSAALWNRRTALASGSGDPDLQKMQFGGGDHAELARLAERCTSGDPWYKEGDLCGRQTFEQFLPQDRAFIAAANPATVLALIAENAALRVQHEADMAETAEAAQNLQAQRLAITEAERKLAEARGLLERTDPFTSSLAIGAAELRQAIRTFLSSMQVAP